MESVIQSTCVVFNSSNLHQNCQTASSCAVAEPQGLVSISWLRPVLNAVSEQAIKWHCRHHVQLRSCFQSIFSHWLWIWYVFSPLDFFQIYLFLISFQHTYACVLQAQDLPFRTYEIRKDFFFAFCALLFSKKRKFCWPWASLLPVACVWHCFYSWDCILVLTVQKDSVCIQGDFLSWKFSWLKASLLSSSSWAISHLLAALNPNGQSWRL